MNILLLSNYSIGCVPFYARRAITKLGHTVFGFSPDYNENGWTKCEANVDANELVKKIPLPIDLILCIETSTGTKFFPRGLDTVSVPTAWWGIDNHLNYRWHKEYANLFDVAFFAQKEYLIKAQNYGTQNIRWLPLGCDEEIHRDRMMDRIYDVSFVGNLTPNRKKYFNQIGVPIHLVSGVYLDRMAEVYSQSKIVLNISAREELNMRVFEAMCAGALLITQRIEAGICDLFEEGKHFIFHDINNAGRIIEHYLNDADKRNRISEAGKEIVLKEHTYLKRIEKILSVTKQYGDYRETRRMKYSSYKICIQEGLVYNHRSFKLYTESRQKLFEAFKRNPLLTILYIIRFTYYRLIEKLEKSTKKNF